MQDETEEFNSELRQKILDRIEKAAFNNLKVYAGCGRATLHALQTHFYLEDKGTFNASSGLAARIGNMGGACGALTAAVMAIGLVFGSEKAEDKKAYTDCISKSVEMCDRFKEKFGSSICFEIQEKLFGRTFDFNKEQEAEEYYALEGANKCGKVCGGASRISADIILKARRGSKLKGE